MFRFHSRHQEHTVTSNTGSSTPEEKSSQTGAPVVSTWEDDPESAVLGDRPVPDREKRPFAFRFPTPVPPAGAYHAGTREFRYWGAVEALRRGADFWAPRVPGEAWQPGE